MARETQAQWDARRAEAKAQAAVTIAEQAAEAKANLAALRQEAGYPQPVEAEAPEEVTSEYDEYTKDELIEELKGRELPHTGKKGELIARLVEDDESEDTE